MSFIPTTDVNMEIAEGHVPGHSFLHKFGRNPSINVASGFEAIWNGGGDYTGFNATAGELIEVSSSDAEDAGTLVSSGTATGGSATTLVDSGATFVSDGASVGDIIINDTLLDHGMVSEVTSETILTFRRMRGFSINASGNSYRVAAPSLTGQGVVRLDFLLDDNYVETSEYVILNGLTGVDTVGSYLRNSRVMGLKSGSVGSNVGTITTKQKITTANIFAVMPIGYNTTMIAAFTIPFDEVGLLDFYFATLSKKQAGFSNVRFLSAEVGGDFQVKEEGTVSSTGSSFLPREYSNPKNSTAFPPMTDIKIMADTSVNDMGIAAAFDMTRVKII